MVIPAGISTFLSTMAWRIRHRRPTVTFSKKMLSLMSENELMRTFGLRTLLCTWPPEMMHPSQTRLSVA